ncbi:hypothetical protein R6Z07M_005563 [Ovis aries]
MLPKVLPADKWASGSPFLLPPFPYPSHPPQPLGTLSSPTQARPVALEEPEHPGVILPGKEGPPRPGKKAAAGCRQRWTHARWVPKAAPIPAPRPPPRRIFPGGPRMLFRSRRAARSSLLSHSPHTEA